MTNRDDEVDAVVGWIGCGLSKRFGWSRRNRKESETNKLADFNGQKPLVEKS
jgi:hypothetical protein